MSRKVFALAASLFAVFATAHAGDAAVMDAPPIDQATSLTDTHVLPVDATVEGVSLSNPAVQGSMWL